MNNTLLNELVNFNTDRGLDKLDFNLRIASMNILEELLEAHGVHDNKDRMLTAELYQELKALVFNTEMYNPHMYKEPTEHCIIDAFCDIQVYAFGEPLKMGYSPILCLSEANKEIQSRVGSIIDGKFVKDKSPEAQANWYKADFTKAKYE